MKNPNWQKVKKILESQSIYSTSQCKEYIIPLVKRIISSYKQEPLIIGIQGGQGTGKSTLSAFLKKILNSMEYKVAIFSIDDFYKSYEERIKLAQEHKDNPFYQIPRGMPGTHKINTIKKTLENIKKSRKFNVPIFNKWEHNGWGEISTESKEIKDKQNIIFFEGWCLGIPDVPSETVIEICTKNNINLKKIDPDMTYHKVVLSFIKEYQPLWEYLDYFIMLKSDSPDLHARWRYQKEEKMKKEKGSGMSKEQIKNYVDIFLPFTYVCYEECNPDITLLINKDHDFHKLILRTNIDD